MPTPDPGELDAAALAAAFAAHLRHQHDLHGVSYVPSGTLPLTAPATADADRPASASPSAADGSASGGALPAPGQSVEEVKRRVLRTRAAQWSAAEKLAYLRDEHVGDCRRCGLCRTRKHLVFGVGHPEASIMFVGEAPGFDEDRVGEPFVGAAGRRLDQWIVDLGLIRENVYIANVLKCRPPNNRDPSPEEVATCSPFLAAQIRAVAPDLLVALGRFAGSLLCGGPSMKLYQMRSNMQTYTDPKDDRVRVPLVVTYHPSYVLRSEKGGGRPNGDPDNSQPRKSENEKVMDDLRRGLAAVAGPV